MSLRTFVSRKAILLGVMLTLVVTAPAVAIGVITGVGPSEARAWAAPYVEMLRGGAVTEAAQTFAVPRIVGWDGEDIDGDGAADVVNPTGHAPREHDVYGDGSFGASRDGGARRHAGVDYVAEVGQAVLAPISGFVSKIGFPYPDNQQLRYVEIDNPALSMSARVFYVDPQVEVGQAVRLGAPIGVAQDLQARYQGITEHVHLEIADRAGHKLDAAGLLHARLDGGNRRLALVSRADAGD